MMDRQQLLDRFRQLPIAERKALLSQLQREMATGITDSSFVSGRITSAQSTDRSSQPH